MFHKNLKKEVIYTGGIIVNQHGRNKMKEKKPLRRICVTLMTLLFVGTCLVSASTNQQETAPRPTGNTLYVGGSGPGNYTRIQDAIDNATSGDTVFVFAGLYHEHLRVNVSIMLTGEDQQTTIIDGQNKNYSIIGILCPDVSVSGFTIRDCGQFNNAAGIYIHADRASIIGNTITCNKTTGMEGIWCWNSSGTIIQGNTITNHFYGLALEYCVKSTLTDNVVTAIRDWGIILGNTNESSVTANLITENSGGIYLRDANANTVSGNNIAHNTKVIGLVELDGTTTDNDIVSNNFMRNTGLGPWFLLGQQSHSKNHWDKNYYGRPLLHPKIILGEKEILSIPGVPFHFPPMSLVIPWFAFDWHPAQTPYN